MTVQFHFNPKDLPMQGFTDQDLQFLNDSHILTDDITPLPRLEQALELVRHRPFYTPHQLTACDLIPFAVPDAEKEDHLLEIMPTSVHDGICWMDTEPVYCCFVRRQHGLTEIRVLTDRGWKMLASALEPGTTVYTMSDRILPELARIHRRRMRKAHSYARTAQLVATSPLSITEVDEEPTPVPQDEYEIRKRPWPQVAAIFLSVVAVLGYVLWRHYVGR